MYQVVQHAAGGGWATAFGDRVTALQTNGSVALIPFATTADNIFWQLDDGWRKIGGTTIIDTAQEGGLTITGIFDYWKQGTSGSPSQRKVMHVGTKIKEDSGTDTWADLFTGLEVDAHPNYAQFQDLLIISSSSNSDVPKKWDQSTAANLGGTPPNFAFCVEHKNRMWAAGVASNPSRLYYTALENVEDWVGAGSGSIDISLGDGDKITGLASYKGELVVFKGPYKGSIHRITGSSPSDFARVPFLTGTDGLACVAHSTIFELNDDIGFLTSSGAVHSLKATAAFGDYNEGALSYEIGTWIDININTAQLHRGWATTDTRNGRVFLAVPTGSSTVNDTILCFDYRFQRFNKSNRWSRITAWPVHSLSTYIKNGRPTLIGGGTDGFARELNNNTKAIDTTGIIDADVQFPRIAYTHPMQWKTAGNFGLTLTPYGTHTVDYKWKRDKQPEESETVTQGNAGKGLGSFILGTDRFANIDFTERFCHNPCPGQFRWIRHRFQQATVDHDLHIHGFTFAFELNDAGTEE